MRARVFVTLKREVLDPQGEAVRRGLQSLGIEGIGDVRVGKVIDIELSESTAEPEAVLRDAARRLLANGVIEDFHVELPPKAPQGV
ncbi:MAG: phosphoribosylformylglycinamidine synthase subunit PurS [Polyangiales bacterium]